MGSCHGYRKYANPVINLVHRKRKPKRLPRPLKDEDLQMLWDLLQDRGNTRLRLACALAQEAGLRISEICRVRLSDMDLTKQTVFVRLPNKGNEEGYSYFSEKTKRCYAAWMAERDPQCGHDHLLHSKRGKPCNLKSLSRELSMTLCTSYGGKHYNEEGFDKWSTHRLRHNMASALVKAGADAATVMAAGRWKTFGAMCGYADVEEEQSRRGYHKAMKTAAEQKASTPRKKTLTLAELLDRTSRAA